MQNSKSTHEKPTASTLNHAQPAPHHSSFIISPHPPVKSPTKKPHIPRENGMPLSSTLKKMQYSSSSQGGKSPQHSRNPVKQALKIMPANHDKMKIAKSAYGLENQDRKPKTNDPRPKTQSRKSGNIIFKKTPYSSKKCRISQLLNIENLKNALFNLWKNSPSTEKYRKIKYRCYLPADESALRLPHPHYRKDAT
jgi:hypothetical protein